MSAAVLVLLGVALAVLGAWSIRLVVLLSGAGLGWLLASAFGASTSIALVVALASAAIAFVVSLLASALLFFIAGLCAGAVIGARLFVLADSGSENGDGSWLLAVVFVPAVAVVCGFLAQRWRHRFLAWGTAAAGAALVMAGIGRIGDDTDELWHPDSAVASALVWLLWLALAVAGHALQRPTRRARAQARAGA